MPHDKNGVAALAVGDEITIRAKVTSIQTGEEYCNLSASTLEPMFPSDSPTTITLNTKQVEKVQKEALAEAGS